MTVSPGQMLSHYRLTEKIGEGGMGVVWRAEDERLRRTVALKTLRSGLFGDATARQRFVREARAAAAANHPNIATIYEIDEAEGITFIAMEYIPGENLRSSLSGRRLNVPDALRIAGQIAKGLARAHASGVIHRDLKPANIMIGPDREVKILDFGLARLGKTPRGSEMLDSEERETVSADLTQEGQILGTVHYMSPEQTMGRALDARSDVFSFGTLLYELVTGRVPFVGHDFIGQLNAIAHEPAVPVRRINPDVPEGLEIILGKCLEKDPDLRYQDTRDLVLDLHRVARDSGSGSLPFYEEPAPTRSGVVKRNWLIVATVAVLIVAAVVAERVAPRGSSEVRTAAVPTSSTRIAVLPFAVHGGDEVAYLGEGMVDLLSTALDGAGEYDSADPRALLALVKRQGPDPIDPDQGSAIAEQVGAGLFVLGRLVEAGGKLNVSASIYDDEKRLQNTAEASVDDEGQLFGLVDDLTRQLLGELASAPTDRLARVATTTTTDLQALKAYLEGEREFRAGRESAAAEAFERAVATDPSFALAWYRLSLAARWTGQGDLAYEAIEQGRLHGDQLSASDRRRIGAFHAFLHGSADEAENLFRAIVESHSDDIDAWYLLGETLFHYNPRHGRSSVEARSAFERVLLLEPEHHSALHHLMNVAAKDRSNEELNSLTERFLTLYPDFWLAIDLEVQRAFALEDVVAQQKLMSLEKLYRRGPGVGFDVAVHLHDFTGAESLYRLFEGPDQPAEARVEALLSLAALELGLGRWSAAERELASAGSIDADLAAIHRALMAAASWLPLARAELVTIRDSITRWKPDPVSVPGRAYLLGELSGRLGDTVAVLRHADELEDLEPIRGLGTVPQDLALALRARAAWIAGDPGAALGFLEQAKMDIAFPREASSLYALGEMLYSRAELLRQLGRDEEALRWYAAIPDRTLTNLIYLAPSHLRRAEIYERLGDSAKAVEHYARFAELWIDCDPVLEPLVAEARTTLDALRDSVPSAPRTPS